MNNVAKNYSIDLIKIISMLWIVGFWHLMSYGKGLEPKNLKYAPEITHAVMGVFMFYGAYFLSKYKVDSFSDICYFYKRRFSRFYFLYLLSIVTLYMGGLFTVKPWFKSTEQLILTIFGLSSFSHPNVETLWFMSMLMLFYVITHIILMGHIYRRCFISIGFLMFLIGYKLLFTEQLDSRIYMKYILFVCGLLVSHKGFERFCRSLYALFLGGGLFFVISDLWSPVDIIPTLLHRTLYTFGFLLLLSYFCFKINPQHSKALNFLSYVVLSVYLFHRQVYQFLTLVIQKVLDMQVDIVGLYVIFLPTAIIVAFIVQKLYDKLYNKINTKSIQ